MDMEVEAHVGCIIPYLGVKKQVENFKSFLT